jgi:hypothetical protein
MEESNRRWRTDLQAQREKGKKLKDQRESEQKAKESNLQAHHRDYHAPATDGNYATQTQFKESWERREAEADRSQAERENQEALAGAERMKQRATDIRVDKEFNVGCTPLGSILDPPDIRSRYDQNREGGPSSKAAPLIENEVSTGADSNYMFLETHFSSA